LLSIATIRRSYWYIDPRRLHRGDQTQWNQPLLNTVISPRFMLIALIALLVTLSTRTQAELVSGLYDVTLPVASQSKKNLAKATEEGLKTVFIRVSGNRSVINQHQIATAINKSSSYMKQFRYKRVRDAKEDKQQLVVSLEFESKLVDKALRDAGKPLWPRNRPSVLVWVVVDDRAGRRFASSESDPELINAISEHATRRGLAIKLPLLDLEDNLSVSPDQLWRLNSEKALDAAQRYNVDTVLVGRASHLNNGQWLGAWMYLYDQQRVKFDGDDHDINQYIGRSLDKVADLLAADYAIEPVNLAEGGLLMRLSGIKNFTDYARAISYLESVAAIRYANVVDIQGDEIIVRLTADGLLAQLQQSLALDKRLQPSEALAYQGEYAIVLDYNWPN
jgi:uncharacterized protein